MCTHKIRVKKHDGRVVFANCGKCPACEQEKANKIAARIENNKIRDGKHITLFLTLTYSNEFVPYIYRDDLYKVVDSYSEGFRCSYIPVYRDYKVRRVRARNLSETTKNLIHQDWFAVCNLHDGILYQDKVYKDGSMQDYFTLPSDFVSADNDIIQHIDELPNYNLKSSNSDGSFVYNPNKEGKIAVCLNSDIQKFWDRLDINLKRKYNYYGTYSRFSTGEYGENTFRPHFHAVLQIETDAFATFYQAIIDSWKYSDYDRLSRGIEIEKHASSYVASYVNKSVACPYLFKYGIFKPKYSFSHRAGMARPEFSLSNIVACIQKRDLHYDKQVYKDGAFVTTRCMLPAYVLNYYFPKIKGFNKLSSSELADIYSYPEGNLSRYARKLGYDSVYYTYNDKGERISDKFSDRFEFFRSGDNIFLRDEYIRCEEIAHKHHDLKRNLGLIKAALNRINPYELLGLDSSYTSDYLNLYITARDVYGQLAAAVWTIYQSNVLKDSFQGELAVELNTPDRRYINYCDYLFRPALAPTLHGLADLKKDRELFTNINSSAYDIEKDSALCEKRSKYMKKKQVNSILYSKLE